MFYHDSIFNEYVYDFPLSAKPDAADSIYISTMQICFDIFANLFVELLT